MKKLVDLVDDGNILIPRVFGAIDTSNILLSFATITQYPFTYTATEDCVALMYSSNNADGGTDINGISIFPSATTTNKVIQMKKGDVLHIYKRGSINAQLIVFGIKYN